jgi:ATP-dependent DNA helicase RecG
MLLCSVSKALAAAFETGAEMPISVRKISVEEATRVRTLGEDHFGDVKAIEIEPGKLTKHISAFANADGGDLYIGISEHKPTKRRTWRGFANQEAANAHIQTFEQRFPLGAGFEYEFLKSSVGSHTGLVLHAAVSKSTGIVRASGDDIYKRRGAQSLPVRTPAELRQLEFEKGVATFETELVNCPLHLISESKTLKRFLKHQDVKAEPSDWLARTLLARNGKPTVAAVVLFADEPQAIMPKRCGIRVVRYKGNEAKRQAMDGDPTSIDGPANVQIRRAVADTKRIAERARRMGKAELENITYPTTTLEEIITNAVLHRDYSIVDDRQILIFDNRVEVKSPGRFPANVTAENCRTTRFLRNGSLVRYLAKFAEALNKDMGEGLDTAFQAMNDLGLKEPIIEEPEGAVVFVIRHERLASPETAIMEYLESNPSINNAKAREITHEGIPHRIKMAFGRLVDKELIEKVPGTTTGTTAYRKKRR